LSLEAILFRPPQVHAHQHLSPVLSLSASRAWVNVDDRIQAIVFAGEQNRGFGVVEEFLVFVQLKTEVVENGFAFARKFQEGLRVVDALADLAIDS